MTPLVTLVYDSDAAMTPQDPDSNVVYSSDKWTHTPTAPAEQVWAVVLFLALVRDLDHVVAAGIAGTSEGTIRRWRNGDIRKVRKGLLQSVYDWGAGRPHMICFTEEEGRWVVASDDPDQPTVLAEDSALALAVHRSADLTAHEPPQGYRVNRYTAAQATIVLHRLARGGMTPEKIGRLVGASPIRVKAWFHKREPWPSHLQWAALQTLYLGGQEGLDHLLEFRGIGGLQWDASPPTPYTNRSGDSTVASYGVADDSITVAFTSGATYVYTYQSAGAENIEQMKSLAEKGEGLDTFINQFVKNLSAGQLT